SWGLPMSAQEQQRAAELRRELQVQGVEASDDPANDPLISIDRHNSTFIYRASVGAAASAVSGGGGTAKAVTPTKLVQLTSIPGLADIENDLAKAEDAARIEIASRDSIA